MAVQRSIRSTTHSVLTALLLASCCLTQGCRSPHKQHSTGLQAWRSGDLHSSAKRLQKASSPLNAEKEILLLDQSIID
ncbi:MAG: hypothetical protein ACKPJD_05430, partial [Planctomycetaceae bacterium]